MRVAYFILFKLVGPKSITDLFYYFSKFYFGVLLVIYFYIQITIILFLNINKIRNVFFLHSLSLKFSTDPGDISLTTLSWKKLEFIEYNAGSMAISMLF